MPGLWLSMPALPPPRLLSAPTSRAPPPAVPLLRRRAREAQPGHWGQRRSAHCGERCRHRQLSSCAAAAPVLCTQRRQAGGGMHKAHSGAAWRHTAVDKHSCRSQPIWVDQLLLVGWRPCDRVDEFSGALSNWYRGWATAQLVTDEYVLRQFQFQFQFSFQFFDR